MATIKKNTAHSTSTPVESWNTIKGVMRVFVKVFDDVNSSISVGIGKKSNEKWSNFYIPIYIAKGCGVELDEGLNTIDVKNGFFSVFDRKDGTTALQLVITDATKI